jgi:hypothetical protein
MIRATSVGKTVAANAIPSHVPESVAPESSLIAVRHRRRSASPNCDSPESSASRWVSRPQIQMSAPVLWLGLSPGHTLELCWRP